MTDNMRVEVYWNLHKHLYSVRALEGPNKGRVIAHSYGVTLTDVKFVVQPAGRDRVRREGKKNVHAFVRGRIANRDFGDCHVQFNDSKVTYNPYVYDTFVNAATKQPIFKSGRVEMDVMLGDGKRYPRILSLDK